MDNRNHERERRRANCNKRAEVQGDRGEIGQRKEYLMRSRLTLMCLSLITPIDQTNRSREGGEMLILQVS